MKIDVRFDSEGNLWIDDQPLDRARLVALLAFLRARGWLIPLRRGAARPPASQGLGAPPPREVVSTVGRARRVIAGAPGAASGASTAARPPPAR